MRPRSGCSCSPPNMASLRLEGSWHCSRSFFSLPQTPGPPCLHSLQPALCRAGSTGREHRLGAMHVPACVLMAVRLDQNLHLSLLLDYCHHREPKDLKDTKTATLRILFFDILPRGSQSQGAGSSPRENSADGRQREPCRDHSLSNLCSATVHRVFCLFV